MLHMFICECESLKKRAKDHPLLRKERGTKPQVNQSCHKEVEIVSPPFLTCETEKKKRER